VNRYLQLLRLQNGIIGVIGVLASAFIAGGGTDAFGEWPRIVLACVIVVIFMGGGNALNDYVDREIDITSHPRRPIPSGRIQPRQALYVGYAFLVIAVLISLLFWDILCIAIVAVACVLMLLYELTLKQRGLVGNITIAALTGGIFLLGGAVVGNAEGTLVLVGMALLVNIGREITKDIEDMEGDKGRRTLPMSVGKKNAGILAAAFYIAGVVLSILPFMTGTFGILYASIIIPNVMFIYASYILFTDPHMSQKTAKIAMLVALAAFMLGVI